MQCYKSIDCNGLASDKQIMTSCCAVDGNGLTNYSDLNSETWSGINKGFKESDR